MTEIVAGSVVFTLIVLSLAMVVVAARAIVLPAREVALVVNHDRRFAARTGQKLLGVLNDNGISVPSACAGAGTCGLCRVTVLAGGGQILPTELSRLTKNEVRDGKRLACQVVVRDDIDVAVASDVLDVESVTCTVATTRMLSPLIREIALSLPDGRRLDFEAGAFVQVTAPAHETAYADFDIPPELSDHWSKLGIDRLVATSGRSTSRAYSIASAPEESNEILLFVRLAVPPPSHPDAPPGIVSSYLFGLSPGDTVAISGPYKTFGATGSDREMIFIGGGVGMAPLRSIIIDQLGRVAAQRKMSFWYGARSKIDLFHIDELERLASDHKNFSWTVALSDPAPEDDWTGAIGFIHNVVYRDYLKAHPAPERCEYYLCGPPLMIRAVLAMLDECGVDEDSIFVDDFGS